MALTDSGEAALFYTGIFRSPLPTSLRVSETSFFRDRWHGDAVHPLVVNMVCIVEVCVRILLSRGQQAWILHILSTLFKAEVVLHCGAYPFPS